MSKNDEMSAVVKPLAWITLEASDWLKVYDGPACAKITAIHRVPPKSGMGVPVYSEPLTIRPEAEVRAEAWQAASEPQCAAIASALEDFRSVVCLSAVNAAKIIGSRGDERGANALVTLCQSVELFDLSMMVPAASAALNRIKAEAKAEGTRIGAAREKMRALTEWLNEDEDNGELLMASLDGDTIETLRAILAAIQSP